MYTTRGTTTRRAEDHSSNVSLYHSTYTNDIRGSYLHLYVYNRLDDIHSLQDPLSKWPAIGGYLLYITSSETTSEAEEYWRPYVGQASLLIRRIPQHITEVLQGHIHTLCYWVASKPGRQLNFIRLREIIEEEEEEDTDQSLELLNTLLEMIFCLGFQSLPLPTLNRFLGPQEFSLRGLNVVSPLLQNITLSPNERAECRQWLRFSPSLETQQFAETRAKELQQRQNLSLQPSSQRPNYEDIQREFRDQIIPYSCPFLTHKDEVTGKIPSNLRQPIDNTIIEKSVAVYLKEQGVEEYLQAFPFGSNEAPIGFILDFDIPSLKYDGENVSALPAHFPSALRSIGFHEQNCLTWPFNFQAPFVPRKLKLAGSRDGDTYLREINRQIIDNSNLQVIILCGINAERMAILSSPSFKKTTLTIGKMSLEAFLQIEQSVVLRVYLKSLAPLSALYSSDWRGGTMVSLTIKVAACLTQTKGIQPFYFRSRVALSELVVIRLREERGETKMTIDSITDSIWSWLHRRGFEESDIARLEAIGESVSRGILLAMITSPRRPINRTPIPRIFPKNKSVFSHKFTESQLREMREIHNQKTVEWNSEPTDSMKDLSEEEDLLHADEFLEDQKGVILHELALESVMDPMIKRANVMMVKDSPTTDDTVTVEDSLRTESSVRLLQPAKKRTKDTAPLERKGKDLHCRWCKMPTYGERTQPCWCEILQGSLCQQCSMLLSNQSYLPICRSQISHLEIFCGFCDSRTGPNWRWVHGFGLPACSTQCYTGIRQHVKKPEVAWQVNRGEPHQNWAKFQDQMPEKLPMSEDLRRYFKDEFGLDTSREGLRRMTTKRNLLVA